MKCHTKHQMEDNAMKMYIAVLDEFPDHMTPTLVAHSVLAAHLKFQNDANYSKWITESFRKVVVRVSQKEFNKIKELEDVHYGHENKTLEGKETCAVICPREDTPNVLKYAKLWKPLAV